MGKGSALHATRAKALSFATFTLREPIVDLGDPESAFGADHPWDGILGTEALSRFDVTFDYPRAQLLLKPNARIGEPFEYELSGVMLWDDGGHIAVYAVTPRGQGALAGLEKGDVIAGIAGETPPLTLEGVRRLFRIAGRSYELDVVRGGVHRRVTITIKRVL